jgi:hypothetical protein
MANTIRKHKKELSTAGFDLKNAVVQKMKAPVLYATTMKAASKTH